MDIYLSIYIISIVFKGFSVLKYFINWYIKSIFKAYVSPTFLNKSICLVEI